MGATPQATSPVSWSFPDYMGRAITITVTFNNSTRVLTNVVAVREQGCLYRTLLWDIGPDGTPDSSTRKRSVPFGTTTVTRQQLSAIGLNTFEDILAVQFTVGL